MLSITTGHGLSCICPRRSKDGANIDSGWCNKLESSKGSGNRGLAMSIGTQQIFEQGGMFLQQMQLLSQMGENTHIIFRGVLEEGAPVGGTSGGVEAESSVESLLAPLFPGEVSTF